MNRFATALLCASALLSMSSTRADEAASSTAATAQIREAGVPALEYVVGKFADHQLVLLGEGPHRVRQNLEFLQALIPRLYAAGVRNLGYEMVRSATQKDVDRLLSGSRYDEQLANRIIVDWEGVHFGWYREYADVLRAAWKVNSGLPKGAPRFRIVGLDTYYQASDWSQLRPGEKGTDEAVTRRIFGVEDRDIRWAQVIDREIVRKGEKGLIYGGVGHLSTRFHRDRGFGTHHRAAGNLLSDYLGDQVYSIFLHGSAVPGDTKRLAGLMPALPAGQLGVGFDLKQGTPLGGLRSADYGYLGRGPKSAGYQPAMRCGNEFTLSDVMDGYVFLVPVSQFKMVTRIEGALTPEVLRELQRRLRIEAGDPNLAVTREDIERKSREIDAEWRAIIEGKGASQ